MNGLGNDFVVVDARIDPFEPRPEQIKLWGDRQGGIGFDQLICIEPSVENDAFMRVWNSDSTIVETCGNALRCVAWVLDQGVSGKALKVDTAGGLTTVKLLESNKKNDKIIGIASVDMGRPKLDWQEIPLSEEMNTAKLELKIGPYDAPLYHTPCAVNMGNPHVVFFVDDISLVDVKSAGSLIEYHPLFPQGVNVEFVQILAKDSLKMRVWERGAGITKACGTGACASLVAASRRGLCGRQAMVMMDGGPLHIIWRQDDDHVVMTGPLALDYIGQLS